MCRHLRDVGERWEFVHLLQMYSFQIVVTDIDFEPNPNDKNISYSYCQLCTAFLSLD